MSGTAITSVQQFLEAFRAMKEAGPHAEGFPRRQWRWSCVEDLLLKEGRQYQYAALPQGIKYGRIKECYRNAYLLALRRRDLTYVEGYAQRIIPCWHAWCVTTEGAVVDPTWRPVDGIDEPSDYWGIPFQLSYIRRAMAKTGKYGVLYDRELMLTDDPAEFLQPISEESQGVH